MLTAQLKWFQFLPDFSFDKCVKQMLLPFEQVHNFVRSAEKKSKAGQIEVESSLNWIKLLPDFHGTFPLLSKKLD